MRRHSAFTLLEMLLVLVILAIAASMALPNFINGFGNFQLTQAADDLKNRVRWAQATAMARQRTYRMVFAGDNRCYAVETAGDTRDPGSSGGTVFERVPGTLGKTQCLPGRVRFTASAPKLDFYPDGTLDAMDIVIADDRHKLVLSSAAKRGAMVVIDEQ